MFELCGKTALVTGSSQGIGKEIAKALCDAGAKVFVHGSKMSEKLKNAAQYVGTDKIAVGDISKEDIAEVLYAQTGGVDILILNASVQKKKNWEDFTLDDFKWHTSCNLCSSFLLIQKYTPYMKKQKWGRIVAIGSVNEYSNHPQLALYGVTKAAQMKMVYNAAPALAKYGITLNCIAPGAITTPRNDECLADEELRKKVVSSIPIGYIGDAKDMNGAALLLCSDEGRYIVGSEIVVDGGMRL